MELEKLEQQVRDGDRLDEGIQELQASWPLTASLSPADFACALCLNNAWWSLAKTPWYDIPVIHPSPIQHWVTWGPGAWISTVVASTMAATDT